MQTRRQFFGAAAGGAAVIGLARPAHGAAVPLMLSVLTCQRPHGVSYLDGTLTSIDAEVSSDIPRLLVCDGKEVLRDGWTSAVVPPRVRQRGVAPDNKIPGWVAIRTAWTMGADLLFLEDDIRALRRGAFAEMVSHQVPTADAFTSFFGRERPPGRHPARDFRQSQAVKIPLRTLDHLARAEHDFPFLLAAVIGIDIAIGAVSRAYGWTFEQTSNLVEHIGFYSAANPT